MPGFVGDNTNKGVKTPKEASTNFYNIIKASVSPKATGSKDAERIAKEKTKQKDKK